MERAELKSGKTLTAIEGNPKKIPAMFDVWKKQLKTLIKWKEGRITAEEALGLVESHIIWWLDKYGTKEVADINDDDQRTLLAPTVSEDGKTVEE